MILLLSFNLTDDDVQAISSQFTETEIPTRDRISGWIHHAVDSAVQAAVTLYKQHIRTISREGGQFMDNSRQDLQSMEFCWVSVFGSSVARQVFDRIAQGGGVPDDAALDVYVENALILADRTITSIVRTKIGAPRRG